MALVAYDYDSCSENEDEAEEEPTSSVVIINNKPTENASTTKNISTLVDETKDEETSEVSSTSSLFSSLPETKANLTNSEVVEDKIEDFIPRPKPVAKEKQKVKITIPSLAQFNNDDEDEPQKKKNKQAKGSGLMAILPPVRGTLITAKSFVPKSVSDKSKVAKKTGATSSNLVPHMVRKNAEAKKSALVKKLAKKTAGSDLESDDDIEMPETFDDAMWEKVCGRPKPKQKLLPEPEDYPMEPMEIVNIAPEPETPYDGLDNAAFKELVGKNKRPLGNIRLIDINEDEIMQEKDLWMTKSLTDPDMVPKASVEDPVDPTRRKRHHITYLAQQAKANEQELQQQWSSSKNNRMQTRAKYGF